MNISLQKTTALVRCLCILHNYCINEELLKKEEQNVVPDDLVFDATIQDDARIILEGGIATSAFINYSEEERIIDVLDGEHNMALSLLDGGHHTDDFSLNFRRDLERAVPTLEDLPRTHMLQKLHNMGIEERPMPKTYK